MFMYFSPFSHFFPFLKWKKIKCWNFLFWPANGVQSTNSLVKMTAAKSKRQSVYWICWWDFYILCWKLFIVIKFWLTKLINFGFKKDVNFGKKENRKSLKKNCLCIEVKNAITFGLHLEGGTIQQPFKSCLASLG